MQDYLSAVLGVKMTTVVASFFGAAVSLSYIPELTRFRLFTSLMGGALVAVYGVQLLTFYFGLSDSLERAIAFFAGLLAMRTIPVAFFLIDRFKEARIPGVPDRKE